MKAEEKKAGAAKLAELKASSSATTYKVGNYEEMRNNKLLKLRPYGRRWTPSDGEIFEIDPELAVFRGYKISDNRDGIELYMYSSLSGWDMYPVEWSGMLPDENDEKASLLKSDGKRIGNDATTKFADSLDRARILAGFKKFKVVYTKGLHGSAWITDENGKTIRIPDSKDKIESERVSKTYYQIEIL